MGVAEALHVGEYLVAARPGSGTRGAEGIADEGDAGLPVALADIKIDRTDLHVANLDIARQYAQPRHQRKQGAAPIVAHFAQPGIIHLAIDKEIGARL